MKTIAINVVSRSGCGKKSTNSLRAAGNVPCVMYGGEQNLHFYAHENVFRPLIYTPDVHLVELLLDGKVHTAILKEIQFHPVTDRPIHIDFMRVTDDKPVTMEIPVRISGESPGVKAGGKLRVKRRRLKVKGLMNHLPDHLDISISGLAIGQAIRISDLRYDNLEVIDNKRAMVVSVEASRLSAKEGEAVAAGEEGTGEEAAAEATE